MLGLVIFEDIIDLEVFYIEFGILVSLVKRKFTFAYVNIQILPKKGLRWNLGHLASKSR